MTETRIPTQKRSIEKRNRIIEKGFELICEKGFYNTNTTEIAKYAEVSTGIIYQYFNDKKEIFLEGVKNYADNILYPILTVFNDGKININDLDNLITEMIDNFMKKHTISKKAHEELIAISHLDEDVGNIFKESEIMMTKRIVELLKNNHINIKNAKEKIHVIIGIIDNFCHEMVYHKHSELDYDAMKEYVTHIIIETLKY